MKRSVSAAVILLAAIAAVFPQSSLTLADIPALVLSKDSTVNSSVQSSFLAYHAYMGALAQVWPQLDFSTNYGLQYTPEQQIQSTMTSPPYSVQDITSNDVAGHSAGARISVSQVLPTAGSLSLVLENQMTASTYGSQTTETDTETTTSYPDPQFTQKPKLSVQLTQPIFVNGKLIDFDLFSATMRKAEIGYQKADLSRQSKTNQTLIQAVQLYLQIVQLRKNMAWTEKTIAVAQGNLDVLQKNYELGAVAESDLLDSKIGLQTQREGLLQLRSTLLKTERALAHSIGMDSLQGVTLGDEVPVLDFPLSSEQAAARAVEAYPLIRQLAIASEESAVDDVLAGQKYASTLTLGFSYSPRYPFTSSPPYLADFEHSFTDLYTEGSGSDFVFSAGLNIHLFDGGQAVESKAQTAAAMRVARESLAVQKRTVLDQVETDMLEKSALEGKISLLEESVRLAKMRLATEENLRSLGKSTDLSVDSRRADLEAKQNDLWRARADLLLTVLDLASLTGEDISHTLGSASAGEAAK
jgi:outer membrane protein TolC